MTARLASRYLYVNKFQLPVSNNVIIDLTKVLAFTSRSVASHTVDLRSTPRPSRGSYRELPPAGTRWVAGCDRMRLEYSHRKALVPLHVHCYESVAAACQKRKCIVFTCTADRPRL